MILKSGPGKQLYIVLWSLVVSLLQKRQRYLREKVKKIGKHFYETANVKNRRGRDNTKNSEDDWSRMFHCSLWMSVDCDVCSQNNRVLIIMLCLSSFRGHEFSSTIIIKLLGSGMFVFCSLWYLNFCNVYFFYYYMLLPIPHFYRKIYCCRPYKFEFSVVRLIGLVSFKFASDLCVTHLYVFNLVSIINWIVCHAFVQNNSLN